MPKGNAMSTPLSFGRILKTGRDPLVAPRRGCVSLHLLTFFWNNILELFGPFLSNNKKGKFSVRFGLWMYFATKRRRFWELMGVVLRWRMAASPSWDSSSTSSLPHLWATEWEDILIFPWALQSPTTNYHKSNFKAPHASKYFKISRMKNFIFWLCVLVVVVVLLMILVLELVVAATAKSHSPTQCQAGCFLQRDN